MSNCPGCGIAGWNGLYCPACGYPNRGMNGQEIETKRHPLLGQFLGPSFSDCAKKIYIVAIPEIKHGTKTHDSRRGENCSAVIGI